MYRESIHLRPILYTFEAHLYIWGQFSIHLRPILYIWGRDNLFCHVIYLYIWGRSVHLRPIPILAKLIDEMNQMCHKSLISCWFDYTKYKLQINWILKPHVTRLLYEFDVERAMQLQQVNKMLYALKTISQRFVAPCTLYIQLQIVNGGFRVAERYHRWVLQHCKGSTGSGCFMPLESLLKLNVMEPLFELT